MPEDVKHPPDSPVVEVEGLTVTFGDFVAVDQISFVLQPGEIFGFLGPNGAGKSTTIRVLTGQERPTGGKVQVLGRDLSRAFAHLRASFGYVPDFDNHFEELSAFYNLKFFARLYGVAPSRIPAVLARLELEDAARIAVRNFSKGMRKKLSIAREIL
ncbi:MAG: ABC transporter ATP-binding protein, partial [Deltaproteobacteria bacterium]